MHIFGKGAGARGGDGGEHGQSFNKSAVRETKIFNKRSLRSPRVKSVANAGSIAV